MWRRPPRDGATVRNPISIIWYGSQFVGMEAAGDMESLGIWNRGGYGIAGDMESLEIWKPLGALQEAVTKFIFDNLLITA